MKTINFTIRRNDRVGGFVSKSIEVEEKGSDTDMQNTAKLKFLNQYINRDSPIRIYDNLTEAVKASGLTIIIDSNK